MSEVVTVQIINLAFFACGFGMATVIFLREIRLGVQVRREARRKIKEGEKLVP